MTVGGEPGRDGGGNPGEQADRVRGELAALTREAQDLAALTREAQDLAAGEDGLGADITGDDRGRRNARAQIAALR